MIIEFAGMPRSGKSSSIDIVRDYFARMGYEVVVASEAARSCPFSRENRIEIASWAANHALNTVLEASLHTTQKSIVLQDRGLFDALAFFHLLLIDHLIDKETLDGFIRYFDNPIWLRRVDLVVLFDIAPERAIDRDIAAYLGSGPGLITNKSRLMKLREIYNTIYCDHRLMRDYQMYRIDTSMNELIDTADKVVSLITSSPAFKNISRLVD